MARRALLLLNPNARNGSTPIDEVMEILRAGGIDLIEERCSQDCPATELIRKYADKIDLVIVGGGDGTMNAAAPGLVETGLPLGILPLGTANDLARTLGLPMDAPGAARAIVAGVTRMLDLGEVNGHLYFNVASIGFSATLARHLTREAKKRWGVIGYAIAALRLLAQSRPFRVHIEHDGTIETVRTMQVSVGNGRHYGGGMTVKDTAEPDDGRLDVYSLEVSHGGELIALFPALRKGTQRRSKNVRAFSTSRDVRVTTRRRHDVNADGELVTVTPAHFSIRRNAITAFVPAPNLS